MQNTRCGAVLKNSTSQQETLSKIHSIVDLSHRILAILSMILFLKRCFQVLSFTNSCHTDIFESSFLFYCSSSAARNPQQLLKNVERKRKDTIYFLRKSLFLMNYDEVFFLKSLTIVMKTLKNLLSRAVKIIRDSPSSG